MRKVTAHRRTPNGKPRLSNMARYSVFSLCVVAAVIGVCTLTQQSHGANGGIKGWAWNAYGSNEYPIAGAFGLGWMSLNCVNDFDNDNEDEVQCNPGSNIVYQLSLGLGADTQFAGGDDRLSGCAWTSRFGYVCFAGGAGVSQCNSTQGGAANACTQLSSSGVSLDEVRTGDDVLLYQHLASPAYLGGGVWSAPALDERALIVSLAQSVPERGFITFPWSNSNTRDPRHPSYEGDVKYDSNNPESIAGCFNCNEMTKECGACLNVAIADDTVDPDAVYPNVLCWDCGGSGTDACTVSEAGGRCSQKYAANTCPITSCGGCTDWPGVVVNEYAPGDYEMCGLGYHAYQTTIGSDTVNQGLGWIPFGYESASDFAFVGVDDGSVFSRGKIDSPGRPPIDQFNATFIIESGETIRNWLSKNLYLYGNIAGVPEFIEEQGSSGIYANALGSLDVTGIITDVATGDSLAGETNNTPGRNKFGRTIILNPDGGTPNQDIGRDRVFYFDCTDGAADEITAPWSGGPTVFRKATGSESGASIIVVDCDLRIEQNLSYDDANTAKLRNLPSVVWIVRGDVIVDPDVTEIVGTFIVLGDDEAPTCPALDVDETNRCGRFRSGSSDNQLTVYGSVLARQFDFERAVNQVCTTTGLACTSSSQCGSGSCVEDLPSERFVPEGRLQANPPSGITDFSKSVPRVNN